MRLESYNAFPSISKNSFESAVATQDDDGISKAQASDTPDVDNLEPPHERLMRRLYEAEAALARGQQVDGPAFMASLRRKYGK